MARKKCSECGGCGYKEVSVECTACKGDGEVLNDAGNVVECINPRCFYGNVKGVGDCPKCDGTGYDPE